MMDFILVPLVVGIVALTIYKLFELFVRKKERLIMIEKAGENVDPSIFQNLFSLPIKIQSTLSSGTLKAGCLLIGVGLGLLVGFLIVTFAIPGFNYGEGSYQIRETVGVVYGASVLLFGGLSLLIAFLLEMKYTKKHDE